MRMSALSEASGVPVATVKYYLREGLLHPGEQTSATQARYDQSHVERLRLVRALLDVGRLSIAAAREVLRCLQGDDVHESLGRTLEALGPAVPDDVDTTDAERVLRALGWSFAPASAPLRQLASAMRTAETVGLPLTEETVHAYARAAHLVAEQEIGRMPRESLTQALTYSVVGTVLYEPILLALRRLAHQDVSAALLGPARSRPQRCDADGSGDPA